jgi:hypothetical protein
MGTLFLFYAKFKIGKHLSPEFKVNKGLRLLLNVMLEIAIIRSKVETWGIIFDKCQIWHMLMKWLLGEGCYKM